MASAYHRRVQQRSFARQNLCSYGATTMSNADGKVRA
jgi:hypothetical protein